MNVDWSFAWSMLLVLGIFHGINPAMGWLFAVGLGLQEQRRAALWRALLPLALGHGLAIAAAILGIGMLGMIIPITALKWGVAVVLFSFGVYRLFRQNHPRYGGMQVGPRELTIWSFLMASAHGAGLMVLPFVFRADESMNHAHASMSAVSHGAHTGHMESMLTALLRSRLWALLLCSYTRWGTCWLRPFSPLSYTRNWAFASCDLPG